MKNKLKIGSWITLNHYSIVEILSLAKFDWLCVDMEHSVTDFSEAQQLISTIQAHGMSAYVRVGENNKRIIKRVLDAGADGIIIPMINNANEAKRAVESVYYPPKGSRGVGLARAQKYGFGFEEYKKKKITVIAQIEHFEAIDNLEEILSVDYIDGTLIGPYDLSGSMGKPGQYDDNDVKDKIELYEKIAKKHEKMLGFHVINPDAKLVIEKIKKGYNFIAFSLDTLFLGENAIRQMKKIR